MAAATEYPTAASAGDSQHPGIGERPESMFFSPNSPTSGVPPPIVVPELDGTSVPEAAAAGSSAPPASDATATAASPTRTTNGELPKEVQEVLSSEIGIVTMLNRLKHSVASSKEFALFLKKRAQLEEDYAAGMRKLARSTQDNMSRGEHAGGSFNHAFGEMMDIHARMADNGYQFSMSLHQMHDDLLELAAVAEKNRKGWKQTGLSAEQRVTDLETATRKSKAKYESLAEEYDRARTGDVSGRRGGFGFKGPKSAAQHEEELLRKLQLADEDYHGRVDTLSRERSELLATGRPEIIKALQDLVHECDGGMVLQVQKYASFSEKLLLSNGLSISPLKSAQKPETHSLREIVTSIDSEKDLNNYIAGFHLKVPPKKGDPKYERHPVLASVYGGGQQPAASKAHNASQSLSAGAALSQPSHPEAIQSPTGPPQTANSQYGSQGQPGSGPPRGSLHPGGPPGPPGSSHAHERSFSYSSGFGQTNRTSQGAPQSPQPQGQQQQMRNSLNSAAPGAARAAGPGVSPAIGGPAAENGPYSPNTTVPSSRFYNAPTTGGTSYPAPGQHGPSQHGPPQLGALSFQTPKTGGIPNAGPSSLSASPLPPQQMQTNPLMQHPTTSMGPPSRPVFGVSLDVLYERDSLAVPMVVYQCIQAVDLFGLTVEGIYRLSGSLPHVNKLKSMFDTDSASTNLDFRNPENFFHDVNSVAGLLKQFFRDLPDPLLTREHYDRFIDAAQHDDATVRRDSLHAVINDLPDPNYATLRALILHLNRVVENASVNRMTAQNLAIVFGPTLLGAGTGDPEKGRWHVRVIDTILQNTYQIFDED